MNWKGQCNDSKNVFGRKSGLENCNLFYKARNGIFLRHDTFWFKQGHLCLFFFPLVIELRMLSGKERKKINSFFSVLRLIEIKEDLLFISFAAEVVVAMKWSFVFDIGFAFVRVSTLNDVASYDVSTFEREFPPTNFLSLSRGEQIIWDHAHHIQRRMWKIRSKLCSNLLNNFLNLYWNNRSENCGIALRGRP